MRATKPALLALATAALALAGCGGGGDDSTSTAKTTVEPAKLSKAALISQGDAICAEVNVAVGAANASTATDTTTQVAGLYAGMVESLGRLGEPAEAAGYAEFKAAADELGKMEGEVKLAAEREDSTALAEAETGAESALAEFQTEATLYGFTDCGEGPQAPAAAPNSGGGEEEEATEGGLEVAPEEEAVEEAAPEAVAPEEVAPETGGATGGGVEEAAPEAGGETGGGSGGVGPG